MGGSGEGQRSQGGAEHTPPSCSLVSGSLALTSSLDLGAAWRRKLGCDAACRGTWRASCDGCGCAWGNVRGWARDSAGCTCGWGWFGGYVDGYGGWLCAGCDASWGTEWGGGGGAVLRWGRRGEPRRLCGMMATDESWDSPCVDNVLTMTSLASRHWIRFNSTVT